MVGRQRAAFEGGARLKFSVVIPVYNVAPYLRECLDSLRFQSFSDWEAVCVDDGSTDGSGAILDEYAAVDKRFRVVHQSNAGVSAARNVALKAVGGDYVTFLDGDDIYGRDWLAEASRVISETGVDLLRMGFAIFSGKTPAVGLSRRKYVVYEGADAVREWGYPEFALRGFSWLCFMRREKLLGNGLHGFPDGMKLMEDCIFMIRNASAFDSAAQSEFPGYCYRVRQASATCSRLTMELFVRLFQEYRSLVDDMGADVARKTAAVVQNGVVAWANSGDRRQKDADRRMADMVRQMVRDGYFDLSCVSWKWRLGCEWVVRMRSFFMIDVLLFLARACRRIRAVFLRGRCAEPVA